MKKKLDTRFPAGRIKKIMQADGDVGKIAMAVPLLVSKALELFLQELCNQTYGITLKKGGKTVNSLHLKQCIQTFNVFDFLREIVGKVPDLGEADTAGVDPVAPKRKVIEDGENDGDNESKRSRGIEIIHAGNAMRGKGKRRSQGRGQGGAQGSDGYMLELNWNFEDDPDLCEEDNEYPQKADIREHHSESKENVALTIKSEDLPHRDFDLNVSLDEIGEWKPMVAGSTDGLLNLNDTEKQHEDYPSWSLAEAKSRVIHPIRVAYFNSMGEDKEDDYDEEG
ncbi:hypothetical protein MLD38_004148 [Melastoma candidum]|uniref:Uncharacterized protein n=1 Tax=Melastoma candidum TaxID=119954 RepID=A0ACB9S9F3_9MYRT|nr:hypothetical protein MLD38_004148 [Melastoma candidum]